MRARITAAFAAALSLSVATPPAWAQHDQGHSVPADSGDTDSMAMGDSTSSPTSSMRPGPLDIPPSRMGSGTSWLPDDAPMHAAHLSAGAWTLMLHGAAYGLYDKQFTPRGGSRFVSINWGMLMASRSLAGGRLYLRGMFSAEPLTVSARGYPLLLQTGESFQGLPLHDRQHPHDLFMELSALYERAVSHDLAVSLYLAPVGEPAIGPVAFPHRPSAENEPLAPLAHHWQDATHISFGVITAGIFTRTVKLEGSIFNGREPDEHRYGFDYKGRSLDSYAARIFVNPDAHWSLSASYAFLKSPEELRPNEAQHRLGGAVLHSKRFGSDGDWSTALIYGANQHSGGGHLESSLTAESNLNLDGRNALFGRLEYVRKSAEDLVVSGFAPDREFNIGSVVLGYVREVASLPAVTIGLGVHGSLGLVGAELAPVYGTRTPAGLAVFIRVRPARMGMAPEMRMAPGMTMPP